MRVALQHFRPNGGSFHGEQVFVISGLAQDPHFRLSPDILHGEGRVEDFCLVYLGAPAIGGAIGLAGADEDTEQTEPYVVYRRGLEGGQVVVAARLDWEGVFTILSNDDECAELLFEAMLTRSAPEEVNRSWTDDRSSLEMFQQILLLA
ncbi:MAG: hypothetical protein ACYC6M_12410 [Terriglobales bacterium]